MTTIRPARIEDANSIAFVQVESWKTTYVGIVADSYLASLNPESRTQNWHRQLNAGATVIFVAEDEGGIFGFVSGGELRDKIDGFDAELYAIYLLQNRQRQGVGEALTRQLANALCDLGFHGLIVWVLAKNPAVTFYQHLGGVEVATKEVEIGGTQLTEIAFGWPSLGALLPKRLELS